MENVEQNEFSYLVFWVFSFPLCFSFFIENYECALLMEFSDHHY